MIEVSLTRAPDRGWYWTVERTVPGWLDITLHGRRAELVISLRYGRTDEDTNGQPKADAGVGVPDERPP